MPMIGGLGGEALPSRVSGPRHGLWMSGETRKGRFHLEIRLCGGPAGPQGREGPWQLPAVRAGESGSLQCALPGVWAERLQGRPACGMVGGVCQQLGGAC